MKNVFTLSCLMLLLSFLAFGQNNQLRFNDHRNSTAAQKQSPFSKRAYGKALNNSLQQKNSIATLKSAQAIKQRFDGYFYEALNNDTWEITSKDSFFYDVKNNLVEEIEYNWNGNSWDNSLKNIYTYNANGQFLVNVEYKWKLSQWVNSTKYDRTYDGSGKLSTEIQQEWDDVNGKWINHYKNAYSYDLNGNITEDLQSDWSADLNEWVNSLKDIYFYTGNNNTQIFTVQWDEELGWTSYHKNDNTFDGNNNNILSIDYYWSGSIWANAYKIEYTFDTNNSLTQYYGYDWNGSEWKEAHKAVYTCDNSFSLSSLIIPFSYYETTSVLFSKKLLSYINYNWDTDLNEWGAPEKCTLWYSEQNTTAVPVNTKAEISVYPNPVADKLSINIPSNNGLATIEIFDMQGHKVLTKEITCSESISLQTIVAGMYLYQLSSNGEIIKKGKLIKE